MDYLIKPNALGLFAEKSSGKAMISSLTVAEVFGKRHDNVVRDIKSLDCSPEFTALNFEVSKYKAEGQKRSYPCYNMTKDGFIILVFGWKDKKSMDFKEKYINAFNAMANHISEFYDYRRNYPDYTDAIKEHYDRKGKTPQFAYSTEEDMINKLVLGVTAREFKRLNGLDEKEVKSIKPFLTHEQIRMIHKIQTADILLLEEDVPYKERKERLTRLAEKKGWFIGIQPITLPEEIIDK
jgi:Rha family phage regulatory protein